MSNAPPRSTSAAPATVQATDLLDLMMRLSDLLTHETELVGAGRVRDIAPLQREKVRLAVLYQKAIKDLEAAGAKINMLAAPLRAQLFAASSRLTAAVGENERALRIGSTATRRLVDMVVESVKAKLKTFNRYNARLSPARAPLMPAMAIDRRM